MDFEVQKDCDEQSIQNIIVSRNHMFKSRCLKKTLNTMRLGAKWK
jgi:hypothetical protein